MDTNRRTQQPRPGRHTPKWIIVSVFLCPSGLMLRRVEKPAAPTGPRIRVLERELARPTGAKRSHGSPVFRFPRGKTPAPSQLRLHQHDADHRRPNRSDLSLRPRGWPRAFDRSSNESECRMKWTAGRATISARWAGRRHSLYSARLIRLQVARQGDIRRHAANAMAGR